MSKTKTWNPRDLVFELFGHKMEGFAEGTMVTVKDESPRYQSTSGCDGEVAVSVTADPRVNVTLSLLQTSDSNDILAAQDALASTAPGVAGWGPIYIKDLNGRSLYEGKALVVERPESTFGATAKNRDWKLLCIFTSRFDGGATQVS